MREGEALEQFAKDLQALLAGITNKAAVYEGEAPRDSNGYLTAPLPFVVYTANVRSPNDEGGVYNVDLLIDVWALNSWASCYREAILLDDVLNSTVHDLESGALCCDQNGQIMQRMEKDPDDERIRRMQSQYLIRFYPNLGSS